MYYNRCYEPWRIEREKKLEKKLKKNVKIHSFNGSLLWEPWEILKDDGTPYRVFTPFYRRGCLNAVDPRKPLDFPKNYQIELFEDCLKNFEEILPDKEFIEKISLEDFKIGEEHAFKKMKKFVDKTITQYKDGRNLPAKKYVSRLSPHLHFGEISPN